MNERVGLWELDTLVRAVGQLYATADKKRTLWDVWFHTCHHTGALATELRTEPDEGAWMEELADTCLWFLTAIDRIGRPKPKASTSGSELEAVVRISGRCSDLLWQRYAIGCPSCVREPAETPERAPKYPAMCQCNPRFPDDAKHDQTLRPRMALLRTRADERRAARPDTIIEWQQYLSSVFQTLLAFPDARRVHLGHLLLEQLGSTSDALIRTYSYTAKKPPVLDEVRWRQTRLELELARFLCLLFLVPSARDKDLADIIGRRYGPVEGRKLRCWACHAQECVCPLQIAPSDVSIEDLVSKMA